MVIKLSVFFAVAYAIQIYIKGKIEIEKIVRNPASTAPIFFGVAGIIFNFLFTQFQKDSATVTPEPSQLFGNDTLQSLFSEEGWHGLKYWDLIKIVAALLILMEWNSFRRQTNATGGKVAPLTTGVFLLMVLAIGLTAVPDLIKTLKSKNFSKEVLV